MKLRKAVIPCAGYGTRFLPITKVIPKELLPIGNKPAIHYVVEEAVAAGIEEIILVCNQGKHAIIDYFLPNPSLNEFLDSRNKKVELAQLKQIEAMAQFRVVYQEQPRGLGDAVLAAREAVGQEPFLVILPDDLIAHEISGSQQLINACQGGNWGILLERVPMERVSAYGVVQGRETKKGIFQIEGTVEKPRPEQAPSDLTIIGRYVFPPEIFSMIASAKVGTGGEIQLTDAINTLAQGRPGCGVVCQGRRFDVGTPQGLQEANLNFQLRP